jgi:hypothetical protein
MKSPRMEVMGNRGQTNRAGAPAFPANYWNWRSFARDVVAIHSVRRRDAGPAEDVSF